MSTVYEERSRTIKGEADHASTRLCELAEEMQITPREKFDSEAVANALWEIASPLSARPVPDVADPEDVINACRLAMEGGANEYVKLALVAALLEKGPPGRDGDTSSVRLLIDTFKQLGGRFEIAP